MDITSLNNNRKLHFEIRLGSPSAGMIDWLVKNLECEDGYCNLITIAEPAAGGTVSGSGKYALNSVVSINAVANSGYVFRKWSDGVTSASRDVVLTENLRLSAIFEKMTGTVYFHPGY